MAITGKWHGCHFKKKQKKLSVFINKVMLGSTIPDASKAAICEQHEGGKFRVKFKLRHL